MRHGAKVAKPRWIVASISMAIVTVLCLHLIAACQDTAADKIFLIADPKLRLAEADSYLLQHPNDLTVLSYRADALVHLKRNSEALEAYGKILKLDPRFRSAWTERAGVYFAIGRYEECLSDCEKALAIEPRDSQALQLSCDANEKLKRLQPAVDAISKVIDDERAPRESLLKRASLYRLMKQYDKAIADCTRVLAMWKSEEAFEERAKNYELFGQKQLAADDREESRYLRKNTVKFTVGRPVRMILDPATGTSRTSADSGASTERAKKPPKFPKGVDISDTVAPGLSQLEYYRLARAYGGILPRHALQCIERAETINPKHPMSTKASALRRTMLPRKTPPTEAIELNWRAYNCISDHKKCRELATECTKRFPEFEYGFITLGALEKDEGNTAAAEECFRHALTINPDNVHAMSRLGDIVRWHNLREAKALWSRAVLLDPDDTFDGYMLELYKDK